MSRSRNEILKSLTDYLPGGRLFSAALRTDSNIYKFLYGVAEELRVADDYTRRIRNNIHPDSIGTLQFSHIELNEILSPQNLTESPWTETGTSVVSYNAQGVTGLSNTASTLTDDSLSIQEFVTHGKTIPNDFNTHVVQFWLKKDSDTSRFPTLRAALVGGTTVLNKIQINTMTGAIASTGQLGEVSTTVIDKGDWWNVIFTLRNNLSGNTLCDINIYPAAGTVLGVDNVAAVGSCIIGYVSLELNKTIPTNIFTDLKSTDAEYLDEWEEIVGIPDGCFPGSGTLEERRGHVLLKLASLGVQTAEDFEDLAEILGVKAVVTPYADVVMSPTTTDRFVIQIEIFGITPNAFPLTFPIQFGSGINNIKAVQCLFNKLKPANCRIVFEDRT